MNKQEFLQRLRDGLRGLAEEEIKEIVYDYEEHFNIGKEQGKKEEDIARELGSPENIAGQYRFEGAVKKSESSPGHFNLIKAIFAGIALGFFNLVFVLGIYMGLLGALIGLIASSISLIVAGMMVMIVSVVPFANELIYSFVDLSRPLGRLIMFLTGLGLMSTGIFLTVIFLLLGKIFYKGTLAYVKENIKLVKKAAE